MEDVRSYVIATSPRSGSTLLCRMLAATGVAGVPESYFHTPSVAVWFADYWVDPAGYVSERSAMDAVFAEAMRQGRGGTDVFGLRLQRPSFAHLVAQLEVLHPGLDSDVARFEAAFGRTQFVHLTRGDKLGQAVSMVRAEQTGLWHRHADGSELERLAPPAEPAFDGAAIARKLEVLAEYDRDWEDWFAREGIAPVRVTYQDLAAEPVAVLRRVLTALGADPARAEGVETPTAKLADAVSAAWVARFRREFGN